MGKATILSGGEDGRYTIEVDLGEDAKAARIAALNAKIAQKTAQIVAAEAALAAIEATAAPARAAVNAAIEAYIAAVTADPAGGKTELAALEAARKTLAPLEAAAQSMRINVAGLKADKISLQKQLTATQAINATLTQQAWCADLTEDATGEVATIEIPGEQNLILIQAAAPAPTSGDGRLTAREIMSPEQAYFNAAILPGWQKWMPTYRAGTITAIDYENDTADVTLDAATSSAQALGVNLQTELPACPVEYMTCNAGAFVEGDRVVVRFDDQLWSGQRTVIGFVDHPQPCIDWPATLTANLRWESTVGANAATTVTVEEGDVVWNCTPHGYSLPSSVPETDERDGTFVLEAISGLGGIFSASGITPGSYLDYHSTGFFTQNPSLPYASNPPGGGLTDGVMYEPRAQAYGGDENIELLKMQTTWPIVGPLVYSSLQLVSEDPPVWECLPSDPNYDTESARVSPQLITITTELGPVSVLDFLQTNGALSGTTLTLTHIDSGKTKEYEYSGATRGAGLNWQAQWTRVDPP